MVFFGGAEPTASHRGMLPGGAQLSGVFLKTALRMSFTWEGAGAAPGSCRGFAPGLVEELRPGARLNLNPPGGYTAPGPPRLWTVPDSARRVTAAQRPGEDLPGDLLATPGALSPALLQAPEMRLRVGYDKAGEAFGHGTGHGLGIEVHEDPRISRRRPDLDTDDAAVASRMVFTIEPGAYLPGWGGVRIEDDVLVTDVGVDVLTNVTTELIEV